MFAGLAESMGAPQSTEPLPQRTFTPTPVKFPQCSPKSNEKVSALHNDVPLVTLLQSIQRPVDVKLLHLEAIGLHVTRDASPQDLIPDPSFLPRSEEWQAIPQEDIPEINEDTRKPLCNGNLSPGVQTYRDRLKELQIDNTAAFRTIRRIPAPAGETPARLGNSYEFYKNLEFFSGYWPDTSIPPKPESSSSDEKDKDKEVIPPHLQTHVRTGTGAQMPADYRQSLLSSFIKLVAYDFGCNVSFPRVEPRLILTHPPASPSTPPPTYFNSAAMFVYRTPTDRGAARSGILEGPVAALSSRSTTGFTTELDEHLDLAREVVATLLTAQQRAREGKTEVRFGEGKWWTSTPRWGGGPGGPIGKEGDRIEEAERAAAANALTPDTALALPTSKSGSPAPPEKAESKVTVEAKRQIHSITGPPSSSSSITPSTSQSKRTKKSSSSTTLPIYDNYRKLLPPTPTWDRKARYLSIGRIPGASYDDIFMVSALNHHISIVRTRVPTKLLEVLDGSHEVREWERVEMWRSRWFDIFLAKDRVEAMEVVWGMMGWLMRKIEDPPVPVPASVPDAKTTTGLARSKSVKMTGTSGEPIAVRTVELDAPSEKTLEEAEKMDLS